MSIRSIILVVTLFALAAPARAACMAPTPPDVTTKPAKPTLPVKGPCVDAKPGTTGCLGWESYTYNDGIRAYNEKAAAFSKAAQAYVDRLNVYVKASGDYAQCEVKTLQ